MNRIQILQKIVSELHQLADEKEGTLIGDVAGHTLEHWKEELAREEGQQAQDIVNHRISHLTDLLDQ